MKEDKDPGMRTAVIVNLLLWSPAILLVALVFLFHPAVGAFPHAGLFK